MDWEQIKSKIKEKFNIIEINKDTIEFKFNGEELRLHRFEVPNGFLVSEKIKQLYNNKIVAYRKINGEWLLWI